MLLSRKRDLQAIAKILDCCNAIVKGISPANNVYRRLLLVSAGNPLLHHSQGVRDFSSFFDNYAIVFLTIFAVANSKFLKKTYSKAIILE